MMPMTASLDASSMAGIITSVIEIVTTIGAVAVVVYKLGRTVEKFEAVGSQQAMEIKELQTDVKLISSLMRDLALQNQRLENSESRMERMERMVDDIRRGEGRIFPLAHGKYEVP